LVQRKPGHDRDRVRRHVRARRCAGGRDSGAGDAALIAAGTLAGEGRLSVGIVLGLAMAAWMLGSVAGYYIGRRGGRELLERPGWLAKARGKLLAKGDHAFGRHNFTASVTMPPSCPASSG
jgi:hypothetical protein